MKSILHIIHGLNLGGAENFIFNLLSGIDSEEFRFDFVIQEPEIKHKKFEELIIERGGRIHIINDFFKNPIAHARDLKRVIATGYDVIHIHMNAFINPLPAVLAAGNGKVIIHSHSKQNGRGGVCGKLIHYFNRSIFLKSSFERLSCSEDASVWMFGNKGSKMIYNAVDIDKYSYKEKYRDAIRSRYSIKNEFVIGQVGRLIGIKNQAFSIRLLSKLRQKYSNLNVKLMLVGDGEDKEMLEQLADELNIAESIIFVGPVHNANEFYSAFDLLIVPSVFEGLAFVAIEAQAAGLRCVLSDAIPIEANASGQAQFCSLDDPDKWMEVIYGCCLSYDRSQIAQKIIESNFNLTRMVLSMVSVYNK